MKTIQPFTDKNLIWDEDEKKYFLTREYVNANFENPFNDDGILDRRIRKNTRVIYNYIYSRSNKRNREVIDFVLSRTEEGRKVVLELLSTQLEADLESAYNDLNDQPLINLKSGQIVDRNAVRQNRISPATEDVLEASIGILGINLLYAAQYPISVYLWMKGHK